MNAFKLVRLPRRDFLKLSSLAAAHVALVRANAFAAVPAVEAAHTLDDLRRAFATVPDAAKPGTYWWWFNGLVNEAGITRDLEEFRAQGIGGVLMVFTAGGLGGVKMPQGAKFLSPEWRALYRHAIREAARLQLEVGINLCAGWAMGGPWITPENAGRWFLQSRLTLEGPQRFSAALPLPGHRDGYDNVFNPPGFKDYIDLPLEKLDYRDTSIVAFPEPGAKLTGDRAKLLPAKTNRKDASNFTRARDIMGPTLTPWAALPGDVPIAPAQVIDLTGKVTPDGRLDWEVPAGRWTILRTGHRMTGSKLMIAMPEADGLSVDWFKPEPVDVQFEHLGRVLIEEAQSAVKAHGWPSPLQYFSDDSFEDGFPNWTDRILERFAEYRGYDPRPYLPVLAGYLVGSAEVADRFLHDYRKTVADCMADGHYGRFAELCHGHGLRVQNESAGPSRSGTICLDGLKNLGRSDLPMGEFWLGLKHDEPGGLDPKLGYGATRLEDGQNKVTKMVASAAHVYGRALVSAEAFTSYRHWKDYPGSLKQATDRAFCEGVNRIMIHTSTATRPEDGKPGYEYGAGTHFNPNVTWWRQSGAFLGYIGRCQHLLRSGRFVADVLYYNGDGAPNLVEPKRVDPSLGAGFDYDVCNAEVLLTRVEARDGRLVLPDGMSYRLLVLPDGRRMPVEIAAKLRQLVAAGATIVGPKPERDSGLRHYPQCDRDVAAIAADVWGDCDGRAVTSHRHGQGRVFWNVPLREILAADGVRPDFEAERRGATAPGTAATQAGEPGSNRAAREEGGDLWIDFIHRTTPEAEIYFVANRHPRDETAWCAFRVTGRQPQIWDPVTAEIREARDVREEDGRTIVPLRFASLQSYFVVFPSGVPLRAVAAGTPADAMTVEQELTGAWTVKFDPAWGGPASIEFAALEDWTKRPEEGIRFYSGTATYLKHVDIRRAAKEGERVFLDLGVVRNIADVRLNGRALGTVWTAPWRIEITRAVRAGDNVLEIDVVNQWPNRLIGDAALPPEKRLTRTNITFKPDEPLLSSGLLGPVRVLRQG